MHEHGREFAFLMKTRKTRKIHGSLPYPNARARKSARVTHADTKNEKIPEGNNTILLLWLLDFGKSITYF